MAMSERRLSASSDSGHEEARSPKRLQRSIRNQLASPPQAQSRMARAALRLGLRCLDLSPTLPGILMQMEPQACYITSLDVSYSLLEGEGLAVLCENLRHLETLLAVNCGLTDLKLDVQWPRKLRTVDLSRNRLTRFPPGMETLLHLEKLNLSGNQICSVDPSFLRLPKLAKLYLLSNPIGNIPRSVCREGVWKMREYFRVEPLPPSEDDQYSVAVCTKNRKSSLDRCRRFGRILELQQMESTESGYDSSARLFSTSSCSSLSDIDQEESDSWPSFHPEMLPQGYTGACTNHLCQVYLPDDCLEEVHIETVKDISLYPRTKPNELLITPVVRITPHGLKFTEERPAIVVLSHCTKCTSLSQELVPMCSNTNQYHPLEWTRISATQTDCKCKIFQDCVMFSTTHFSLFAVVSVLPYPHAQVEISPNEGSILSMPELPGFQVCMPPGCLCESSTVKATVYYADPPFHTNELALASVCVGLEPHGMEFTIPVDVSIPIPNFEQITATFHDATLQVWYTPFITEEVFHWEQLDNAHISIQDRLGVHIATFQIAHFSFFKLLWTVCRDTLVRLGYGASFVYKQLRARYVSVRCQVFMSPPQQDLTFGLLVVVYKFGDPLTVLSNYPWPLADTGDKRVFLKTGEISIMVEGYFNPRSELGETGLSRMATVDFGGEDFCLRFEFALRLRELTLPLQEHQLIGKMWVSQWDGTTPVELNLIKPPHREAPPPTLMAPVTPPQQPLSYMDVTPPWTPESDVVLFTSQETSHNHNHTNLGLVRGGKRRLEASQHHSNRVKRRVILKEGVISDKFLMEVAHGVGSKWEELGIALDLDFDTIRSVVSIDSGRPEHMKAFYVLQEWKRRVGEEFSHQRLAAALEEAGLNSTAQRLCYTYHSLPED